MRLSRECDAAEDGRVAIFNNPRGKRRLVRIVFYLLVIFFVSDDRFLVQLIYQMYLYFTCVLVVEHVHHLHLLIHRFSY
jgi:hypothetical protein